MVTGLADGGFVVDWTSVAEDGSGLGVYARRFDASGTPLGGEIPVTTTTTGDQYGQSVAARPDGGFVAAWASSPSAGNAAAAHTVETAIFSASAAAPGVYVGTSGADALFGSSGNDTLIGGGGADTYVEGRGAGVDIVDNRGHGTDGARLLFDANISFDQLWFQQSGNDLNISIIGTGDNVSVAGWYQAPVNHVASIQTADGHSLADTQVQNLVAAMAAMAPPAAGQLMLTTDQHQQLDAVLAANWQSH